MRNILTILIMLITLNVLAQPAGTLDPTFGNAGKVVTSISTGQDKAYGIVIQSDGKTIVAGNSTSTLTGKDFAVVRYNTDGSLDNTFGNNGIVTTDVQLGSDDVAYSVALQTDGKIVLAGYSDNGSNKEAAIVRYNNDGTLDNTFGINGIVLTDFENSQQDEIKVVKIHPLTGNIIVGGATIISSSVSKPVVARYLSNGTLDNTFNNNGIRLLWITSLDYQYLFSVEDLIVQANGKISAVGWRDFPTSMADADYWACRINSDGTMDNTFSSDGVNVFNGGFNGNDKAFSLTLRPSGNLLVAGGGYINTMRYDFSFFEINNSGSLATSLYSTNWGNNLEDEVIYSSTEDNNGRIIFGGFTGNTNNKSFAIARITSANTLDNSFGTNGKTTTTFGGNSLNECFGIAIQTDNKIVAVGYTGGDFAIARYLGNEIPDLNNFQLITPINQSVDQNITNLAFTWSNAFGAIFYEIDIDVSQTFNSTPQTFTVSSSNYNASNLLPNMQYYWRVRASDGTNWGTYSDVWSFTTKNPSSSIHEQCFSDLKIYPNPTTDFIHVEIGDLLLNKPYKLLDHAGKEIFSGILDNKQVLVKLKGLSSGVYLLQIGDSPQQTYKLLKE